MRGFIILFCLCWGWVQCKPKYVSVDMYSKWPDTSLILEVSEFMAQESNELFWRFVNSVAELDPKSYSDHHEEAMYQLALKYSGRLLSPVQVNLLKFALAIRAHSPAVQMYNQIARDKSPPADCDAFIDINNMITCELAAVKAFLSVDNKLNKPTLTKNDHHYPGTRERPVTAVLYAELGQPAFVKYHNALRQLAEEGKINYVLRHYVREPGEEQVKLSGYGVELAIKNTEYKARDDTKVEDKDADNAVEDEDELHGFVFSKLKQLYPEQKEQLNEFRQHLLDTSNEIAELKAWQMQDLSMQAAQQVISAPKEEALKVLRDISQDFPTQAKNLVKTAVNSEMKKEIQNNQRVFESALNLYPGDSAMFINGIQAELDVYDVFTLLDTLRSEAKVMEGLHTLGLKETEVSELLTLDLKDAESRYAVDIRDPAVMYINNIEKDKKYASYSKSVQELLRPTFPGMLRHIRKNLFNIIFIVDPADASYKELLKMAEAFYVHNAPIRIGVVFVVNTDKSITGLQDAGVAMLRAFNYVSQKQTPAKALSFLTDVYERAGEDNITAEMVTDEFLTSFTSESINLFGVHESEYDTNRLEGSEYFKRVGLGSLPQVLMNGMPMKKDEIEPDVFEESCVTQLLKVTPDLQRAVYHGHLTDQMDVLEYLMSRENIMPRLNPQILSPENSFYLDTTADTAASIIDNVAAFTNLAPSEMTAAVRKNINYLTKKKKVPTATLR